MSFDFFEKRTYFRFFKWLLRYNGQAAAPFVLSGRFSVQPDRNSARRRLFSDNPIREAYRKFLVICKKTGIQIETHKTSADYERHARARFKSPEDAGMFRSLYINTRYGEKTATPENRRKMKEILAGFKKHR